MTYAELRRSYDLAKKYAGYADNLLRKMANERLGWDDEVEKCVKVTQLRKMSNALSRQLAINRQKHDAPPIPNE